MMTREEAIRWLEETIQDTDAYWNSCSEALQRELDEQKEVFLMALSALRPVSREQVERMRGEWEFDAAATEGEFGGIRCSKCHTAVSFGGKHAFHNAKTFEHFCSHCGAPMTDEAVQMVMERVEALHDNRR